jgi:hypothetical protein
MNLAVPHHPPTPATCAGPPRTTHTRFSPYSTHVTASPPSPLPSTSAPCDLDAPPPPPASQPRCRALGSRCLSGSGQPPPRLPALPLAAAGTALPPCARAVSHYDASSPPCYPGRSSAPSCPSSDLHACRPMMLAAAAAASGTRRGWCSCRPAGSQSARRPSPARPAPPTGASAGAKRAHGCRRDAPIHAADGRTRHHTQHRSHRQQ